MATTTTTTTESTPDVVLVTGANSGCGYETVKCLLGSQRKYHILVGARTVEKAKSAIASIQTECPDALNTLEPLEVDLVSDESIQKAFEQVKASPGRLDVLVNNAGATFDIAYTHDEMSLRDCFNGAYNVNVTGTNVLTHMFMPLLFESSSPRLLFVGGLSQITAAAEGNMRPTQPQPAGWPKKIKFETIGYRCSKVALNMLMLDWHFKLKEDKVKVWCVAPGFLATNLGGRPELAKEMGAVHPRQGGEMILGVVEGKRDADVGKFVSKDGFVAW